MFAVINFVQNMDKSNRKLYSQPVMFHGACKVLCLN